MDSGENYVNFIDNSNNYHHCFDYRIFLESTVFKSRVETEEYAKIKS